MINTHNIPPAIDIVVHDRQKTFLKMAIGYGLNAMTYADLKNSVELGHSLQWVQDNLRPAGVATHIVEDLYYKAKQELWEEKELMKTNIGRLLYG